MRPPAGRQRRLLPPPLAGATWRSPFRRFVYLGLDRGSTTLLDQRVLARALFARAVAPRPAAALREPLSREQRPDLPSTSSAMSRCFPGRDAILVRQPTGAAAVLRLGGPRKLLAPLQQRVAAATDRPCQTPRSRIGGGVPADAAPAGARPPPSRQPAVFAATASPAGVACLGDDLLHRSTPPAARHSSSSSRATPRGQLAQIAAASPAAARDRAHSGVGRLKRAAASWASAAASYSRRLGARRLQLRASPMRRPSVRLPTATPSD